MADIKVEAVEISGVTQKEGEKNQAFIKRVIDKINALPDEEWQKVTSKTQNWVNSVNDAIEAKQVILPNFDGEIVEDDETAAASGPDAEKAPTKKAAGKKKKVVEAEAVVEAKAEKKDEKETDVKASKKAPKNGAKAAKPDKAPAKVKAAAAKANGKGPGRPSVFKPEAKIKVLSKKNPFREGSNSHKVFGYYKPGMTVGEFEKQVAKGDWKSTPKMFLMVHASKGLIAVG